MKKFLLGFILCLTVGCASANYKVHPGAVNTFDSQSYDTLYITHNVIESTKAQLASNAFPPALIGGIQVAVNNLVLAYNTADVAYRAYHAAMLAGAIATSQQTDLTVALDSVNAATATLTAVKGGK